MNAVALMRHTVLKDIIEKADKEYENMYHNGSLHDFPYEENESEIFWDWLSGVACCMAEDLETDIKEIWGFDWTIYQHGRSGATFYPEIDGLNTRSYGYKIDLGYYLDCDPDEEDPDQVKEWCQTAKEYYEAFQHINKTIRENVNCVADEWKIYKEEYPDRFKDLEDEDENEYREAI